MDPTPLVFAKVEVVSGIEIAAEYSTPQLAEKILRHVVCAAAVGDKEAHVLVAEAPHITVLPVSAPGRFIRIHAAAVPDSLYKLLIEAPTAAFAQVVNDKHRHVVYVGDISQSSSE